MFEFITPAVVNMLSCGVMLAYVAIVSIVMPGRGLWRLRCSVWLVAPLLAWQFSVPVDSWVTAGLHATVAALLILGRRMVVAFIRYQLAQTKDDDHNRMRRFGDWYHPPHRGST